MEKKRKYKLLEFLNALSVQDSKLAKAKLPLALGVSKDTFNKWLYILEGAKAQIPSDHLATLANYFKCPINELFNQKVQVINHSDLKALQAEKTEKKFKV